MGRADCLSWNPNNSDQCLARGPLSNRTLETSARTPQPRKRCPRTFFAGSHRVFVLRPSPPLPRQTAHTCSAGSPVPNTRLKWSWAAQCAMAERDRPASGGNPNTGALRPTQYAGMPGVPLVAA